MRYAAIVWREQVKPKPTTEDELERIAKLNKPYLATLTFDQLTKMPKKRQGGRI
jgi:hypothetical protein